MGLSLKKIGSSIKKAASSINKERKRAVSSVGKELERGVKNPDVWKAAALVAAPFALPALGGAAAGAGSGFMSTIAKAGSYATSFLPGGAAAGTTTGTFLGNLGLSNLVAGPMGPPAPGQESDGFFSGIFTRARGYASGMSDDIRKKMADPNYMKGMLARAGQHLAGSLVAGDGLSDEERKLMNSMSKDLSGLRDQDRALFDRKFEVANKVIAEGERIDPTQMGLQAQRDVQIASGTQMREADKTARMREGGRGFTAGDWRRIGLDTTRNAQSAYLQGQDVGRDARIKTIATGAQLLPTEAPRGAMAAGLDLAEIRGTQETRRGTAAENAGKAFQDIFFHDKAKSLGGKGINKSVEEANKKS